jgi:hypothetical protein
VGLCLIDPANKWKMLVFVSFSTEPSLAVVAFELGRTRVRKDHIALLGEGEGKGLARKLLMRDGQTDGVSSCLAEPLHVKAGRRSFLAAAVGTVVHKMVVPSKAVAGQRSSPFLHSHHWVINIIVFVGKSSSR